MRGADGFVRLTPGSLTLVHAPGGDGREGSRLLARLALQAAERHAWVVWITALDLPERLGSLRQAGVRVTGTPGLTLQGLFDLLQTKAAGADLVLVDGLDQVGGGNWLGSSELAPVEAARILVGKARARGFAAAATGEMEVSVGVE